MSKTTTRLFEYRDDKSAKFWEVTAAGATVTVRYGKIGTTGQSQTKDLTDGAAVAKHIAKLIAEKTGKGYVESGGVTNAMVIPAPTVDTPTSVSAASAPRQKSTTSRRALATNPAKEPDTSPESLLALLDKDDATNRLLAKHPRASGELLEKLSHSSDQATRRHVAGNPNTPLETYVKLGQQFPKEFLANPALDLLLMVNPSLMEQIPEALLIRLLKQANCPAYLLTWAAGQGRAKVQLVVAMHPEVPEEGLAKLRASKHESVLEAVRARMGEIDGSIQDPEQAFEQAVRDRLYSMLPGELEDAWQAKDIGLAQWAALPLTFRLAKATNSGSLPANVIVKMLRSTNWSIESIMDALPNYQDWDSVLGDPNVPLDVLEREAENENWLFRKSIAGNLSTPESVLEALSKDAEASIRRWVVENPSRPVSVLEVLATDEDLYVRSGVAGNSLTPASVLEALSKDADEYVRYCVARNPSAPFPVLEQLSKDRIGDARRGVSGNTSAPASVLEVLAKDKDDEVRRRVAENPSTPVSVLEVLIKDKSAVRCGLAKNPSATASTLELLAKNTDKDVRCSVAENPSTPATVLEALAQDKNSDVRELVAKNPSTPVSALVGLAKDKAAFVRWNLVDNPSTPFSAWELLVKDKDEWVRRTVAENPSTPAFALEVLAKDESKYVRQRVAENPATPASAFDVLAKDNIGDVLSAVAANPNTPLEILNPLIASKSIKVRSALAKHAHESLDLRNTLLQDVNVDIRSALLRNQNLDQNFLEEIIAQSPDIFEDDIVTLIMHPNLSDVSIQLLVDKLLTSTATSSLWFRDQLAKVGKDVSTVGSVLTYAGKDPNKAVLAKRAIAPIMALSAGPFVEISRIVRLAGSNDWLVRAAVARNRGAPSNLIGKLKNDPNPIVSALANYSSNSWREEKLIESQLNATDSPNSVELNSLYKISSKVRDEVVSRLKKSAKISKIDYCCWVLDDVWGRGFSVGDVISSLKNAGALSEVISLAKDSLDRNQLNNLWQLAALSKDPEVRSVVAAENTCPKGVVLLLECDNDPNVLMAALSNPLFSREKIIERLLVLKGSVVKELLAREDIPVEFIMAKAKSKGYHSIISRNTSTPYEVLKSLSRSKDLWVREGVAENTSIPAAMIESLSESNEFEVLNALARNPCVSASVLDRLYKGKFGKLLWGLGANTSASEDLLSRLAKHKNPDVRRCVAENSSSSNELLELLARSTGFIRYGVALNSSAPASVLQYLSLDKESDIREMVAANPSTERKILEELANDVDKNVRRFVASNVNSPASVLSTLSSDLDYSVRSAVASNPSSDLATLEALQKDQKKWIGVLARENLFQKRNEWKESPSLGLKLVLRAMDNQGCINEADTSDFSSVMVNNLFRALEWLGCVADWYDNKALTKASRSKDWLTRLGVALHPAATEGILKLLRKDTDPDVASAAALPRSAVASIN